MNFSAVLSTPKLSKKEKTRVSYSLHGKPSSSTRSTVEDISCLLTEAEATMMLPVAYLTDVR